MLTRPVLAAVMAIAVHAAATPAVAESASVSVTFDNRTTMDGIVAIQLQRVERLLADRRMTLSLDPDARVWLGERGYDPVYGARPLKRVIQKELIDPIARKLLSGDLADGAVIEVQTGEGGLVIGRARVH